MELCAQSFYPGQLANKSSVDIINMSKPLENINTLKHGCLVNTLPTRLSYLFIGVVQTQSARGYWNKNNCQTRRLKYYLHWITIRLT